MRISHTVRRGASQTALLAAAIALIVITRGENRWQPWALLSITTFTVGGELLAVRVDVEGTWLSASFLGVVLTAVLYGGGFAAALGGLVVCGGWLRTRETGWKLRNNLVNCVWAALLAALAFQALRSLTGAGPGDPLFYALVLPVCVTALVVNIVGVAICIRGAEGVRAVIETAREMVRPLLAAELFSTILTIAAAWVTLHLHLVGLVMFGVVLASFQYLVAELLTSKQRSDQLEQIATTDALTGLGNRESYRLALQARIASSHRFVVMLMDLDRFKEVNDTLGHLYGDRLLQDLGPRLQALVGERGTVARLGGDEFGILLAEDADDAATIDAAVRGLLGAVAMPFSVDELSLEVGGSIGVARFPVDGADSHALLRCADIAMYAAKEAQTGHKLYVAEQNLHSRRRLNVLSDIRRALAGEEIVVHYQPIVDLATRRVTGAEGLVRWEHPEHGLIAPGAFVQTVEQSGLIGPLTRRVLDHSIAQCAQWRAGGQDMSVAVNLSVRNLLDRDLPHEIERLLDHYRVPAGSLQLEITESMIMSDPERAIATVSRLSNLGVRMSVDDFGTGYSSLANLRRLPIDELKIDRSFVSPMLQDESDLIIVRSTINLGHDLGLNVIAEGVEDGQTLECLASLGCDLAQGYHLSRPLAPGAFSRWLAAARPSAPSAPAGWAGALSAPAGCAGTSRGLVAAAPDA